jgi:hypothetical protein
MLRTRVAAKKERAPLLQSARKGEHFRLGMRSAGDK